MLPTNGGTVSREGDSITYIPPAGSSAEDTFTYTITDGHNQPVSGTVRVKVVATNYPPILTAFELENGFLKIQVNGGPGTTYRIEVTENLGHWLQLSDETTDENGTFEITFAIPSGSNLQFYRAVSP